MSAPLQPGWYPDPSGKPMYWNGSAWGGPKKAKTKVGWLAAVVAVIAAGMVFVIAKQLPSEEEQQIDDAFLAVLRAQHVPEPKGDPIAVAKALCRWYDETGAKPERGTAQLMSEYPELATIPQAVNFTDAATSAYCPQHSRS